MALSIFFLKILKLHGTPNPEGLFSVHPPKQRFQQPKLPIQEKKIAVEGNVFQLCVTNKRWTTFFNNTLKQCLTTSGILNQFYNKPDSHKTYTIMNSRKIKLALTVGLMNAGSSGNPLQFAKEILSGIQEVGSFLGLAVKNKSRLNAFHERQTYALQYENCTVDLDLVSNPVTHYQYVQGFQVN
jgi:hypothetical protein